MTANERNTAQNRIAAHNYVNKVKEIRHSILVLKFVFAVGISRRRIGGPIVVVGLRMVVSGLVEGVYLRYSVRRREVYRLH